VPINIQVETNLTNMFKPLLDHLTLLNVNDERTARDKSSTMNLAKQYDCIYHPMTVQYPSEPGYTYTMEVTPLIAAGKIKLCYL